MSQVFRQYGHHVYGGDRLQSLKEVMYGMRRDGL